MKILLSEECPIYREGIKSVLKSNGHSVHAPESKEKFFKICSTDYDFIFIDLDWLKTQGFELAQELDAWSTYSLAQPCRVIATYKDYAYYYRPDLFHAGIKKPFSKEKLLQIINKEYFNNVERFNYQTNSRSAGNFTNGSVV